MKDLDKLSRFKQTFSKKYMVYKIPCKDYDTSYMCQTGRKLKTRISEHRNYIKWNTFSYSVITEYRTECNNFNWMISRLLILSDF